MLACVWVLPSCPVASMVPMLLDLASTPLSVRYQVPWSTSSWKTRSARGSARHGHPGGGVAVPVSMIAAIDMSLLTLPGS